MRRKGPYLRLHKLHRPSKLIRPMQASELIQIWILIHILSSRLSVVSRLLHILAEVLHVRSGLWHLLSKMLHSGSLLHVLVQLLGSSKVHCVMTKEIHLELVSVSVSRSKYQKY